MENNAKKVVSKKEFVKIIKQTVKEFLTRIESKNVVNVSKSNKPSWCISVKTQVDGQLTVYYNYKEFINIYEDFNYSEQKEKVKTLTENQLKNFFCMFQLFNDAPLLKPITVLRAS